MSLFDRLFSRNNTAKKEEPTSPKVPSQEERLQTATNYLNGSGGMTIDEKLAASMYQQLAQEGYAPAFLRLGRCYRNGWGVDADPEIAEIWLEKAAELNDTDAMVELGELLDQDGESAPEVHRRVIQLFRKAADLGNDGAQYYVGLMYFRGDSVEKNETSCHAWMLKSAQGGCVDAQFFVAEDFENGDGTDPDPKQAFYWHTKAAEGGHEYSQLWLGLYYLDDENAEQDLTKAVYWCQKAAEHPEYGQALRILGQLYEQGLGVAPDREKAISLYQQAIDAGEEEAKDRLLALTEKE